MTNTDDLLDPDNLEASANPEDGMMEEDDGGERILNQDEIDSLLGFGDDGQDQAVGISALVNSSMVAYERLPMLEVAFDRLVRMLSTSMRNFTSDNVEVTLENMTSIRFGDYLDSIPLPALLAVVKAEEWDNMALITVESPLIYSIVDVLLGGRGKQQTMRIEGRPYTTIERKLIERMVNIILSDMSEAFDPLSPVTFNFERLETNPRFATIARPANAAILIKLRVDMEDRGGTVDFCLPYATLEPVREILLQMFMGEKFGRDSIWETHLASELLQTGIGLQAVLGEQQMTLHEAISWKVGSQIQFMTKPEQAIDLCCGSVPLFKGHLGQKNSNIAVKVHKRLIRLMTAKD
ncbi:MAG: flagellar motor switch protein FliM [Alphaproteobacteria bacterium]